MSETPVSTPPPVTNRDFAKGAGTTVLARLGAIFEVVSQPLYVLMFGLAGYGLFAVLWAVVTLVENIADLGMPAALQRVVPQSGTRAQQAAALRAAMIIGVTPSIAIALAASICAPLIAPLFNVAANDSTIIVEAIRVYVWTLPLWAFSEVATAALRSKRVFGAEIRLRLVWEQLIRLALASTLWLGGLGTRALLYAHIISLFVICLLAIRLLSRYFDLRQLLRPPDSPDTRREILRAGLAVLPGNIVGRLFADGPALLLNWLIPGAAGAVAAALYVIARKVSSIVQLVRQAFGYVLAPLASSASQGEDDEVRTIYAFVTRLSFALALPIGAVLIGGAPVVLRAFGSDAAIALPALIILTIARIIEAVIGSAGPIQQVTAGFRSQLVGSVVGLGVAMVIAIALMPGWGLTGMALAVGAGIAVSALIPLWQLHIIDRLHPFAPPFARVMRRSLLLAIITAGIALLTLRLPALAQLPALITILLASLWASARLALPFEDRKTLGKTARRLKLV